MSDPKSDPAALARKLHDAHAKLSEQIGRVIVGQAQVIEQTLICLFCRGHALLVGVPGLAKTLLVSTIARTLNLKFSRIQFTPDLMPSDITGTEMIDQNLQTGTRQIRHMKGPVFTNILLADEINRTPPKTQAALLEAMQERQVTAGGERHPLPDPFFVLATQNPIEQEGTYPLPEAQLDRFMFEIRVGYPDEKEELEIVRRTTAGIEVEVKPVLSAEEVIEAQHIVREVPAADHVIQYALRLVRATRLREAGRRYDFIDRYIAWGAGPRASQNLIMAGKARAILAGRSHVEPADIRAVAHPVLRHRIITNFNAEADGVTSDEIISRLIEHVPIDPTDDATKRELEHVVRTG